MLHLEPRPVRSVGDGTDAAAADGGRSVVRDQERTRSIEGPGCRERGRVGAAGERLAAHREVVGEQVLRDRVVDGKLTEFGHRLERSGRARASTLDP